MRVKILNSGGYFCFSKIFFPIEVNAEICDVVMGKQMVEVGCDALYEHLKDDLVICDIIRGLKFYFVVGESCKVISHEENHEKLLSNDLKYDSEFYELMQEYRHAPIGYQEYVVEKYNAVIDYIEKKYAQKESVREFEAVDYSLVEKAYPQILSDEIKNVDVSK